MDHSPSQPRRSLGLSLSLASPAGEIDPVCGMTVDPAAAPAKLEHAQHGSPDRTGGERAAYVGRRVTPTR